MSDEEEEETEESEESESDEDDDDLPFDVELERMPSWVHVASLLVVIVGVAVALHLVPMLAFLPFLLASSIGRRFLHTQTHVVLTKTALHLGDLEIARENIVDVWLDTDEAEPRVTVHTVMEDASKSAPPSPSQGRLRLSVLHFTNREQAIRFAEALRPSGDEDAETIAAGHAPGPVDSLSSLRFIAVAASFLQSGSVGNSLATSRYIALAVFAFAGVGIFMLLRARQVVVTKTTFILRGALGTTSYELKDVSRVEVDAGTITLGEQVITLSKGMIRDTMLASPLWLDSTRQRVLKRIRSTKQVD